MNRATEARRSCGLRAARRAGGAVASGLLAALFMLTLTLIGCVDVPTVETEEPTPLVVGESRELTLEALRLQVSSYEQVLTRADLLALPKAVRRKLWLYDLDLRGEAGQQRLIDNALARIRALDPHDPKLSTASRNMVRLLNMTAGNADLSGTPLEQLLSLAPQVGIAAQEVLAQSMDVEVGSPVLGGEALATAVVEGVIASHPNARTRPIVVSPAHPDGRAPVPVGSLPVTLEDVVTNLQSLTTTFGPVTSGGESHPGFMAGATEAQLLTPEFHMVVRADANALPYKGVDLSHAARASVTSIGKEAAPLFNFEDPEWLKVVGIVEKPEVAEMSFSLVEAPVLVGPGKSKLPLPMGNGGVWKLPRWSLERVVADAALRAFKERSWNKSWVLGTDPAPLFQVSIEQGWMELKTKGNVGTPPAPLYLWDLLTLVAQRRLHDGPDLLNPDVDRIPEGQAGVQFTLKDVSIGVTEGQITAAIQRNLETDPSSLISVAARVLDQSAGQPDVYYVRPTWDAPTAEQGDWLFFIHPDDQTSGAVRTYEKPGFFADAGLTQPVHSQQSVNGDTKHLKVRLAAGKPIYMADDIGGVYRVDMRAKPSLARVRLQITRLR